MDTTTWTLIAAVFAIAVLLLLVIKFKFQEFLALLVTSILFGLAVGMGPDKLMEVVVDEMGGGLGQLALVIGLGAIFGTVLQQSGAAERIATTLAGRFSDRNIAYGLGLAGFLVAISVYIDVAIVILVPMLYGVAKRTGKSLLYYGIPLCAGLSCAYTFMPPAPGPLAATGILKADLGLVIMFGVICGIPAVLVGGPLFGRFISKRIFVPVPEELDAAADHAGEDSPRLPSFASVLGALMLPLVLIVLGTIGKNALAEGTAARTVLTFIGHPVIALLLTALYTLWFFGVRRGLPPDRLQKMATAALAPAGMIILVTGAGSVFGGVLVESGLGEVMAAAMKNAGIPLVLFGFLVSSVMRICQGSGMVAMVTGATFTAPLAQAMQASPAMVALTSIAIACGGAAYSHVNDSGFWMANRYFGMSVADTLKSWTVMKTTVGLTGFAAVLVLSAFVT
ncbi:gluconate:H+ symporter [Nonomuraea sp. NPDC050404]|uniref:GntP family permease n=1 Tax=Nonomuraea sp. NPDC050404 TaxID=3155783 RepID=UPI0033E91575